MSEQCPSRPAGEPHHWHRGPATMMSYPPCGYDTCCHCGERKLYQQERSAPSHPPDCGPHAP